MLRAAGRRAQNAAFLRSNENVKNLLRVGNPSLASLSGLNESCRKTPQNRLLSARKNAGPNKNNNSWASHAPRNVDFATNLIPSYPFTSPPHGISNIRIKTKRIGIRHLTTNNKKSGTGDKIGEADSSANPRQMHGSNIGKVAAEKSAEKDGGESLASSAQHGLTKLGKQVNDRLNVGDLVSVYGIVGLIGIVLVSPFVVR